MNRYKEGKVLKLPNNIFDAKYGFVIDIKEKGETVYRVAIYKGKGFFINTLCRFPESSLEELSKEEGDSLKIEFEKHGARRCTNTLIHETQMDSDGNIIPERLGIYKMEN